MATGTKNTPATHPEKFPKAGLANDGWSTDTEATATCYCGAVQLQFPLQEPGLVTTFVCNCADCHKITASMFASNFTVLDSHLVHLRGQSNLTKFSQKKTTYNGENMANYFCATCGTLMYRVGSGFPDMSILRIGTVDDFSLMQGALRPRLELFVEQRKAVDWVRGVEGAKGFETGFAGRRVEEGGKL